MQVKIVGWHIHPEAAKCQCGRSATVVVMVEESYDDFSLCNECLRAYEVTEDKIEEAFRQAGL